MKAAGSNSGGLSVYQAVFVIALSWREPLHLHCSHAGVRRFRGLIPNRVHVKKDCEMRAR